MTCPRFTPGKLRDVAPWEYALRFAFGGAITVGAHLAGDALGVAAIGMLLAFPSLMPASLTLVKRHDGRACAVDDARGARIGTLGLACFAVVVASTASRYPAPVVFAIASLAWAAVAIAAWFASAARSPAP